MRKGPEQPWRTGPALFHATRAEFLRELGRHDKVQKADRRPLELTANPAQQALLEERLTWS
jgi:predicted RNA polymerase sigma factor